MEPTRGGSARRGYTPQLAGASSAASSSRVWGLASSKLDTSLISAPPPDHPPPDPADRRKRPRDELLREQERMKRARLLKAQLEAGRSTRKAEPDRVGPQRRRKRRPPPSQSSSASSSPRRPRRRGRSSSQSPDASSRSSSYYSSSEYSSASSRSSSPSRTWQAPDEFGRDVRHKGSGARPLEEEESAGTRGYQLRPL